MVTKSSNDSYTTNVIVKCQRITIEQGQRHLFAQLSLSSSSSMPSRPTLFYAVGADTQCWRPR